VNGGVKEVWIDGVQYSGKCLPVFAEGETHRVVVVLGKG